MKRHWTAEMEEIFAKHPDLQRFREIDDQDLSATETLIEQVLLTVEIYLRDSGRSMPSLESAQGGKVDWMSVDESQPTEDGFYWCYLSECPPQSYPQQAIRWKENHWWTSWVVSHWRPLMPAPRP